MSNRIWNIFCFSFYRSSFHLPPRHRSNKERKTRGGPLPGKPQRNFSPERQIDFPTGKIFNSPDHQQQEQHFDCARVRLSQRRRNGWRRRISCQRTFGEKQKKGKFSWKYTGSCSMLGQIETDYINLLIIIISGWT